MVDYHMHTDFSGDSTANPDSMILTSIQKGANEICITDHCDPCYPDTSINFDLKRDDYFDFLEKAAHKYKNKIKIKKGMELGLQDGDVLEICNEIAHEYPYDFIIASFHCLDGEDLYLKDYDKVPREETLHRFYEANYEILSKFKHYCIVGHLSIIDRYIGEIPPYDDVYPLIEEILKLIISDGKGIEINTSAKRYGLGDRTTPTIPILKLYKKLGGEIITFGSDAHREEDILYDYDVTCELLRSIGFRYLATFKDMKPSFVKI